MRSANLYMLFYTAVIILIIVWSYVDLCGFNEVMYGRRDATANPRCRK